MADKAVTAANVHRSSSSIQAFQALAAVALTAGQYIYVSDATTSPPTINLSDANGGSGPTDVSRNVAGVTVNNAAAGQIVDYVSLDPKFSTGATLTSGTTVYLSTTPGAITATLADLTSGSTVISVGDVNTDLTMIFAPRKGGEVA